MGTATWTLKKLGNAGPVQLKWGDITFSSSYAAGGDALSLAALGFREVFWYAPSGHSASRIDTNYDPVNGKVLAYFPSGGAATAPTTLIDPVATATAGSTAVTSTLATLPITVTPGRSKEIAATADLSAVVVRYMFAGV